MPRWHSGVCGTIIWKMMLRFSREMSVVLTVISLGMRVALAYLFSATALGVAGIWIAIPIGWALADMTGLFFLRRAFRSQKPA